MTIHDVLPQLATPAGLPDLSKTLAVLDIALSPDDDPELRVS
ncbi:hypothetical protein GCM10027039_30520 [Terrabacter koreensis]